MSPENAAAWVSAVAASGSLIAAVMAWKAARASAGATQQLTDIESARRHEELTPQLTVKVEPINPGDTQNYRLILGLDHPASLFQLSRLTVTVRDDRPGREHETLPGMDATPEKVRAQVWGPLRFAPLLGPNWARADATGRSVRMTRPLDVGEALTLQMERTAPPSWYRRLNAPDHVWKKDAGTLLRLTVEAVSVEDDRPWLVPIEVDLLRQSVPGFD